jgi:hypothetical protein
MGNTPGKQFFDVRISWSPSPGHNEVRTVRGLYCSRKDVVGVAFAHLQEKTHDKVDVLVMPA